MSLAKTCLFASVAMCIVVTLSNILVQFPIYWFNLQNILTYGAFTYPIAFLVNDLINRYYGPKIARKIVYVGFLCALIISWGLATPRLAIASGLAFLFGQLIDISIFNPLRKYKWWIAPLSAGLFGSFFDTCLFFAVAFSPVFAFINHWLAFPDYSIIGNIQIKGIILPIWVSWAIGDFMIKIITAWLMLLPYSVVLNFFNKRLEPYSF